MSNMPKECIGAISCGIDGECFMQVSGQGYCTEGIITQLESDLIFYSNTYEKRKDDYSFRKLTEIKARLKHFKLKR